MNFVPSKRIVNMVHFFYHSLFLLQVVLLYTDHVLLMKNVATTTAVGISQAFVSKNSLERIHAST